MKYSRAINAQDIFICASDAAYADDTAMQQSTEGYLFQLFSRPINWRSTKQKTITMSTTEAELLTLSHASKETLWWKRLFGSLQLDPGHDITISCNNEQTVGLLSKMAPQYTWISIGIGSGRKCRKDGFESTGSALRTCALTDLPRHSQGNGTKRLSGSLGSWILGEN